MCTVLIGAYDIPAKNDVLGLVHTIESNLHVVDAYIQENSFKLQKVKFHTQNRNLLI